MTYLQELTSTESHSAIIPSSPPAHSHDPRLLIVVAITVVTCFAFTFLGVRPSSATRKLWETIVYFVPSQLVYVMDFQTRGKHRNGDSGVGFSRGDFGNQRAKSEALQRFFGFDNRLAPVVQGVRRLSGLDRVLGGSVMAPAGLGNWDNSCYQNSIIQSFASLPSFNDYLARNVERMSQDDAGGTHEALGSIIGRLHHHGNEGKTLWTPPALKSMNSWQQQDAQEYFSRIMDELDRETSRAAKEQTRELGFGQRGYCGERFKTFQSNPFQGLLAQRVGCIRCGYAEGLFLLPFTCITVNLGTKWEYHLRECLDEYTALESIEGVECIKCSVLRAKTSLDQLLSNIDINHGPRTTAQASSPPVSALRKTVTERLKVINEVCEAGDFSDPSIYKKCSISARGKVCSTKSKQAIVARAPKNLVIHVNRSIFDATAMQRKNHAKVHFPQLLNFDRWCLGSNCEKTDQERLEMWYSSPTTSMLPEAGAEHLETGKLYRLRAVITHHGGHENGHYVAYRKRTPSAVRADLCPPDVTDNDGSWFCFSDDEVFSVSEDHVLSQAGVFMLFYEATNPSDGSSPMLASPAVDHKTSASPQPAAIAPQDGKEGKSSTEGSAEAGEHEPDDAQSAHGVVPGSDNVPPVDPSPLVRLSVSASSVDAVAHLSGPLRSEPARVSAVAPKMRTAGALSSDTHKGRRSSNISMHSPSFVTAS